MGLQPFPQMTCHLQETAVPCEEENLGSALAAHLCHFPRLEAIVSLSILTFTTSLLSYNTNTPSISSDFSKEKSQDALV